MPGDRSADCHGVMRPTQYEIANWSIKIQFLCVICGKIHHNKAADDDEIGELDTKIRHWKATYEVQEAIRES